MKPFFISIILFSLIHHLSGQVINPGDTFVIDSCFFEGICPIVKIDTAIPNNLWQIGKPQKPFFSSSYSPSNAIVTDTINSYPINNDSYFDIVHTGYGNGNLILSFKHKYDTDTLTDGGYIEVSYDAGQTWQNIIYDSTVMFYSTLNFYDSDDTLTGGKAGFSGKNGDWVYSSIQLIWCLPVLKSSSCGDSVIFRFHFISDSVETNRDGWMIDDVFIMWMDMGSGYDEINPPVSFTVFPNPFDKAAVIEYDAANSREITITLTDIFGREIPVYRNNNQGAGKQRLTLNSEELKLSKGIYFLQIQADGFAQSTKLILR